MLPSNTESMVTTPGETSLKISAGLKLPSLAWTTTCVAVWVGEAAEVLESSPPPPPQPAISAVTASAARPALSRFSVKPPPPRAQAAGGGLLPVAGSA